MTTVLATMFDRQVRFKKGKGGKSLFLPPIALLVILFAVSHMGAILGYRGFVGLMADTTWVETVEEMEPLLPTQSDRWRRVGRFMRNAL